MQNTFKVKKGIDKKHEDGLIQGKYLVTDLETGGIVDLKIKTSKYKLQLSNNKQFMKKFTDRKLNIGITKDLREVDLGFLYKVLNYIDEENIIDFKKLKIDYKYTDSKLSKSKRPLFKNGVIREDVNGFIYLNPLVGIKAKEVNQGLMDLFKDVLDKHGVEINFK